MKKTFQRITSKTAASNKRITTKSPRQDHLLPHFSKSIYNIWL